MRLSYEEVAVRKVLNVHKHVDGPWFWGKYSTHPYVGCRHGCTFCYSRGSRYSGGRDPRTYHTHIRVKTNAVERLRKELGRQKEIEAVAAGDWQRPAETRYRLSRGMLKVILELGFPLLVVERSPLLLRDLDLLEEIQRQTSVGVTFSISSVDPTLKRAFEPYSPGVKQRFQAMAELARAGILVGTALLPILPVVGDDERQLEDVVKATKDHGGTFVIGGGLTMDGIQAQWTLDAARRLDPAVEPRWRELYQWKPGAKPSYGPPGEYSARLGLTLRELCSRHGLLDRMPRHVAPGPLAVNKRVAERLFLRIYDLELERANSRRIWAYRRAAWIIDEWPTSVGDLFQKRGEAGLRELPGIGQRLARRIGRWLREGTEALPQSAS